MSQSVMVVVLLCADRTNYYSLYSIFWGGLLLTCYEIPRAIDAPRRVHPQLHVTQLTSYGVNTILLYCLYTSTHVLRTFEVPRLLRCDVFLFDRLGWVADEDMLSICRRLCRVFKYCALSASTRRHQAITALEARHLVMHLV